MNQAHRPQYYSAKSDTRAQRELVTPEGVDLRVKLADQGARLGAFMIDLTIMFVALILLTIGAIYAGNFFNPGGENEFTEIIWLLAFFFLRNFYFTFFEILPKAATPGKRALKIRVASRTGGRLTAPAVFARNALRELEFFLPLSFMFSGSSSAEGLMSAFGLLWSGVFLLFPLFNKDRLRAGDLIAGTWVIDAPRPLLNEDLTEHQKADERFNFTAKQVDAYGVHELHVLEDVIRRSDFETVKSVASRIRTKIEWERGTSENDMAFLKAYYAALRKRLESQLMFGKRRRDKFDTSR